MCLIEQVNRQCQHLKLSSLPTALPALLQQAETNELSYLQYTDLLLGHEVKQRNRKRLAMNRKKAGFPVEKHLDDFDYRHQTTITKRQVNQLLDFDFIQHLALKNKGPNHLITRCWIYRQSPQPDLYRATGCR